LRVREVGREEIKRLAAEEAPHHAGMREHRRRLNDAVA
jgi:hypothetical protein